MANRPTVRKSSEKSSRKASAQTASDANTNDASAVAPRRLRTRTIVLLCAVIFVLLAACLFVWNRWFRFDDAADIQGVWADALGAQVAIDDSRMLLGDKVIYSYTIDTTAKTIEYTFDTEVGHASYRFSGDRNVLVLQENAGTDWLMALHLKDDPALASAENLPAGCTRFQRQEGYAQDFLDAFTNIKQADAKKQEGAGASDSSASQLSSEVAPVEDTSDYSDGDAYVEATSESAADSGVVYDDSEYYEQDETEQVDTATDESTYTETSSSYEQEQQ